MSLKYFIYSNGHGLAHPSSLLPKNLQQPLRLSPRLCPLPSLVLHIAWFTFARYSPAHQRLMAPHFPQDNSLTLQHGILGAPVWPQAPPYTQEGRQTGRHTKPWADLCSNPGFALCANPSACLFPAAPLYSRFSSYRPVHPKECMMMDQTPDLKN